MVACSLQITIKARRPKTYQGLAFSNAHLARLQDNSSPPWDLLLSYKFQEPHLKVNWQIQGGFFHCKGIRFAPATGKHLLSKTMKGRACSHQRQSQASGIFMQKENWGCVMNKKEDLQKAE